MDSSRLDNLEQRLDRLEANFTRLSNMLGAKQEQPKPTPAPAPTPARTNEPLTMADEAAMPTPSIPVNKAKKEASTGNLLGYAGAGCLILAVILLVRLSIDSGWLTPERQLLIATLFGAGLIALPFVGRFKDLEYISQLPAVGIVVWHLTILGGVYYHNLIDPTAAVLFVSAIGILSIALAYLFEYESYAILSIVGTYIGALALKSGFPSKLAFAMFIMVWNIVYCSFAIRMKVRTYILITAYLAIGLVSLKALSVGNVHAELVKVSVLQGIQFLVFFGAVAAYSIINKQNLTRDESWKFFPLVLFFYFLEYGLLDKINPNYATAMAVGFSLLILGVYRYARSAANKASLDSADMVYTSLAAVFAHAFYISILSNSQQVLFGLVICVVGALAKDKLFGNSRFKGVVTIFGLMLAYSVFQVFTGPSDMDRDFLRTMGFVYGILALAGYKFIPSDSNISRYDRGIFVLAIAHAQVLLAIYRLKEYIDRSWVAPLWIAYAFVLFIWAYKSKLSEIAKSAIPLIVLALLRFMIVDFSRLSGGERIISLLVMGALIFAGGYAYRKIESQQNVQ